MPLGKQHPVIGFDRRDGRRFRESKALSRGSDFLIFIHLPPACVSSLWLGLREKTIPLDGTEFGFVYPAGPPVNMRICAGEGNAVNGSKDKQDGELFFP